MNRHRATTVIGIMGIVGGLTLLLVLPAERIHSAMPTVKVPGPYPYETPMQLPVPSTAESSPSPSPAPFPYPESLSSLSAAQARDSQIANACAPLTAKAVRAAAF